MLEKFGTNLNSQASTIIHFRHWIKIVYPLYLTHQSHQRDWPETDKKPEKPNGQESVRLESICSRFEGVIEALVTLLNRFQTGSKPTDSGPSREMYYFNFVCCWSRCCPCGISPETSGDSITDREALVFFLKFRNPDTQISTSGSL